MNQFVPALVAAAGESVLVTGLSDRPIARSAIGTTGHWVR